mmetsp:Transcript_6889/g.13930  ORF Transcript_6889/g.13930 Transcript_6889/m.13930 type:complete len:136 (-) Transcript_6889:1866-2273(-)
MIDHPLPEGRVLHVAEAGIDAQKGQMGRRGASGLAVEGGEGQVDEAADVPGQEGRRRWSDGWGAKRARRHGRRKGPDAVTLAMPVPKVRFQDGLTPFHHQSQFPPLGVFSPLCAGRGLRCLTLGPSPKDESLLVL